MLTIYVKVHGMPLKMNCVPQKGLMIGHLFWGKSIFQLVHMHMARMVLKFNKNIEVGIEKESVQGTSSVIFIFMKPCQMPTVNI